MEYKIIEIPKMISTLTDRLNTLAADGWMVVCYCPLGLVLFRQTITPVSLSETAGNISVSWPLPGAY